MGSGMFPLYRGSEEAKKLLQAAEILDEFLNDMYEAVYSGDAGGGQFDNAAMDGASLAMLSLAKKLIEDEVRKE